MGVCHGRRRSRDVPCPSTRGSGTPTDAPLCGLCDRLRGHLVTRRRRERRRVSSSVTPPSYARSTANCPWEDGSPPIGSLDLVSGDPRSTHLRGGGRDGEGQVMSCLAPRGRGLVWVQMGLCGVLHGLSGTGVTAVLRAPHDRPGDARGCRRGGSRPVRVRVHRGSADPSALTRRRSIRPPCRRVRAPWPRPAHFVDEASQPVREGTLTRWSSGSDGGPSSSPTPRGSGR